MKEKIRKIKNLRFSNLFISNLKSNFQSLNSVSGVTMSVTSDFSYLGKNIKITNQSWLNPEFFILCECGSTNYKDPYSEEPTTCKDCKKVYEGL